VAASFVRVVIATVNAGDGKETSMSRTALVASLKHETPKGMFE
jgi:hypothetical protein